MITMILVVYGTCRRSLAKLSLFYNNNKTYYVYTTAGPFVLHVSPLH